MGLLHIHSNVWQGDENNNGSNLDEIAWKMLQDGKIDKEDSQEIHDLYKAFEADKDGKMAETKQALGTVINEMLSQKWYTVNGNFDTLKRLLSMANLPYDISKIPQDLSGMRLVFKKVDERLYLYQVDDSDNYGTDMVWYLEPNGGIFVEQKSNLLGTDDDNPHDNWTVSWSESIFDAINQDVETRQNTMIDEQAETIQTLEWERWNLTAQVEALQKSAWLMQGVNIRLQNDIARLQEALNVANSKIDQLERDIMQAETNASQSKDDLEREQNESNNLRNKIGDLKKRIQEYMIWEGVRTSQIATLEKQALKDTSMIESLRDKVQQLTETAEQLQESLDTLEEDKQRVTNIVPWTPIPESVSLPPEAPDIQSEEEVESDSELQNSLREEIAELWVKYSSGWNFTGKEHAIEVKIQIKDLVQKADSINFPRTSLQALLATTQEYIDTFPVEEDSAEEIPSQEAEWIPARIPGDHHGRDEITLSQEEPNDSDSETSEDLGESTEQSSVEAMDIWETQIHLDNPLTQSALSEMWIQAWEALDRSHMIQRLTDYMEAYPVYNKSEYTAFWKSAEGYKTAFALQAILAEMWKNPWPIDGVWGPKSQAALAQLGQGKNPGPKSIKEILARLDAVSVKVDRMNVDERESISSEFVELPETGPIPEAAERPESRRLTMAEFEEFYQLLVAGNVDEAKKFAQWINVNLYNEIRGLDTEEFQNLLDEITVHMRSRMQEFIDPSTWSLDTESFIDNILKKDIPEELTPMTYEDMSKLGEMMESGSFLGILDIPFFNDMHKRLNIELWKAIESWEIEEFTVEGMESKLQEFFNAPWNDAIPKEIVEKFENAFTSYINKIIPLVEDGSVTDKEFIDLVQMIISMNLLDM